MFLFDINYLNFCITSEDTTEGRMNATGEVDSSSRKRSCNRIRGHEGAHHVTNSKSDHLLARIHFGSSCCVGIHF